MKEPEFYSLFFKKLIRVIFHDKSHIFTPNMICVTWLSCGEKIVSRGAKISSTEEEQKYNPAKLMRKHG